MHLKVCPEKVKRKRTLKLLSNSLDKNPGWRTKESAMGWDEVAKPLYDNDRKMRFSEAMDSTSELQGFSKNSSVRLKVINEGSCKTKSVRYPNASTLPNDSIIKVVNPSFQKYPKHLRIEGALCLKEHLAMFLNWPESVRKKRSASGLIQLSDTPENTLGSICLGKRQKRGREQFGSQFTHSFPEEVIEEILSRLPVKSVARFRCVCKSWNHLSYSKRFISLHLNNYRTSQLLVGTCCVLTMRCSMYFLPPPPPTGVYSVNDGASQTTVPKLLGGSCNGIVCLYDNYAHADIVLWNPATNESKSIPSSGFPYKLGVVNYSTVGFGFDPKTNDYKILRMVHHSKPNPPVVQMVLYSLRKGSWKKVDSHDFMVMDNVTPVDVACSLPFTDNRIVCAVVSPINKACKWEILCFDMSSESYEIIPVSPSLDAELGEYRNFDRRCRFFKLFPFKETIALGIVYRVGDGSYCDIWMLNSFDSSIQARSWSKYLSTNINDSYIVPVGCWGSSQIVFQDKASYGLFSFDHGNNMMVELGVFQPICVTTTIYKESLVRIDDTKEDEDSKCL